MHFWLEKNLMYNMNWLFVALNLTFTQHCIFLALTENKNLHNISKHKIYNISNTFKDMLTQTCDEVINIDSSGYFSLAV